MVTKLELMTAGAGLRLEADAGGWARCYLVREGGEVFLGAESFPHIVGRLSSSLCEGEGEAVGHISGRAVRWVMSLGERHCSLYASVGGPETVMFWQDADASLIATLPLGEAEGREWCEQLSRAARGEP
jgi:hypothetical protein